MLDGARATIGLCALLVGAGATACPSQPSSGAPSPSASQPSPNASILPRPLAPKTELLNDPQFGHRQGAPDAGGGDASPSSPNVMDQAPQPLREDEPVPPDTLQGQVAVGVSLIASWQWHGVPAPAGVPQASVDAISETRERTSATVAVDVSPLGRMRMTLTGRSFPLPPNTEIRSRRGLLGHILVWSDGHSYRVLPPGTLRALLEERRVDVTPLHAGTIEQGKSGSLLGFETSRTEVSSQMGKLSLEQALVPGAGAGAHLLCRSLVELLGVSPVSSACAEGLLTLGAELVWPGGGKLTFNVSTLLRGQELAVGNLLVPPTGATFKTDELPPQTSGILLSHAELRALRTRDADVVVPEDSGAPDDGVLAVNRTHSLQFLLLDGVPVAWVPAQRELQVHGPRRGRYVVSWRDFLGIEVAPPRTLDVPARVVVGESPDEHAPGD